MEGGKAGAFARRVGQLLLIEDANPKDDDPEQDGDEQREHECHLHQGLAFRRASTWAQHVVTIPGGQSTTNTRESCSHTSPTEMLHPNGNAR